LLLNYLSDLEAHRSSHADLDHSTPGLLNLLLDFVKNIYTSSTERHSTQPAVPTGSPNLPLATGDELLPPAPKIDEEGWEPIFDFNDTTPSLSYYLHPHDDTYSDAEFSETSPDDSSSRTSFESGSEMSCDVEAIVKQAEVREEPLRLESSCQSSQHPTTPPASPTTSTNPQSSNQGKEVLGSIADFSMLLSAPRRQRCSCQPRSKVSALAQVKVAQPTYRFLDVSKSHNSRDT
jgi:hypothetical protein